MNIHEKTARLRESSVYQKVFNNDRKPSDNQEPYDGEAEDATDLQEESAVLTFPEIAWRGVFQTYREAMEGTTEASDAAHFAPLWVEAAARLRRRVKFPYWLDPFTNVFLVIFGPTGDRKTTAARHALKLLPDGGPVKVLSGIGSGEGVADWLAPLAPDMAPVSHVLFLEELSELLNRAKWDGATIKSFLTQVFDCPERYEVKFRKNPISLHEPTLSLLACTTPALFWQGMTEVDLHGGFGNRLLYLSGPRKEPIALPAKPDYQKLGEVHEALARLNDLTPCEAQLSEEAKEIWRGFYGAWQCSAPDPLVKAVTERVPSYCLKLSMVYAAFEGTLPSITAEQITAAIAVGHYSTQCTELLLNERISTSRQGTLETAVLKVLVDASRPLPGWKIHQRIGGRFAVEDVTRAVIALARAGAIVQDGKTNRGVLLYSKRPSRHA